MTIKAVILIGGPNKGQRFRPLSFDSPKYEFPIGGRPIIDHLIESCLQLEGLTEIILLGFYQQGETLSNKWTKRDGQVSIRYLQESTRMGTAGGLYHYRDEIRQGNPEAILVINGDVCGDFDFHLMLEHHRKLKQPYITVMSTEVSREESHNYGCLVEDSNTHVIKHYVEKPSTFVSNLISCGAYMCDQKIFELLDEAKTKKSPTLDSHPDYLSLELDILQQRTSQPYCYVYRTQGRWWCQIKTAASAIYANSHCLKMSKIVKDENNCSHNKCKIIGDVYIHPTSMVDPSAVIGPNVSIMEDAKIGPGVRIKESIILQNATIGGHTLVMNSIIGWNCHIGSWVRIEGTPTNPPLFNSDGKLNPSITVLGCDVKVPSGAVIINSIVLPHKELTRSYKNEIIL